jgi:hypothetical protein
MRISWLKKGWLTPAIQLILLEQRAKLQVTLPQPEVVQAVEIPVVVPEPEPVVEVPVVEETTTEQTQ